MIWNESAYIDFIEGHFLNSIYLHEQQIIMTEWV